MFSKCMSFCILNFSTSEKASDLLKTKNMCSDVNKSSMINVHKAALRQRESELNVFG
jgi:hypothetical protein